jgi:DNA-binding protein Fis
MIPYTLNDTGITFFLKSQRTFANDFAQFAELVKAVIAGDVAAVDRIANPRKVIAAASEGKIVISTDDEVLFNGQSVPDYLAHRLLSHFKQSLPIAPLCAFAEKLMANPNLDVREDMYKWLEAGQMPIYADGDFMAYKLVKADFTPIHSGGKYGQDQSVGKVVEQPRETCNENRNDTCSSGLHFCSYSYLPHFGLGSGGYVVIVLKINPKDVVSIPTDYNLAKGRTCRFEVVDTVDKDVINETFGGRLVLHSVGTYQAPAEGFDENEVQEGNTDDRGDRAREAVERLGTKTAAAAELGISRSTLTRWLEIPAVSKVEDTAALDAEEDFDDLDDSWEDDSWDEYDAVDEKSNREIAEEAIEEHGTKTAAAEALGISRSTLTRWLNS